MNITKLIDQLKCLIPLDDDGKDGEWWLHYRTKGKYRYTHDHLGDAAEHLDRLQDEFWKLRDTAINLCECYHLYQTIVDDVKRHVDGQTEGQLGFIARRIAEFESLLNHAITAPPSGGPVHPVVGQG